MSTPVLDAVCQAINDKLVEDVIHLTSSSVAMVEFKGVHSENTIPMGFSLTRPTILVRKGVLCLRGLVRGKEWLFALDHRDNDGIVRQLCSLFAIEELPDNYADFIEVLKGECSELVGTFTEGYDLSMQERIPGWGKFKMRGSK